MPSTLPADTPKSQRKLEFWESMQPVPSFRHLRRIDEESGEMQPHGGVTIAYRYFADHDLVHLAIAFCNDMDNFCKARGRALAAGRLLSPKRTVVIVGPELRQFTAKEVRLSLQKLVDEYESREYHAWHERRGMSAVE